jgi:integrase/recombinase XerD
MKAEYQWKSSLSPYMKAYLDEMHIIGFKFKNQERFLRQFDEFCYKNNYEGSTMDRGLVELFCQGMDYEKEGTRRARILLMRRLAEFMLKMGYEAYIHPQEPPSCKRSSYQPYIYTEQELKEIFTQIDKCKVIISSDRHIVDPLLFRMLYGCGLRISEALGLKLCDVDLKEGTLRILHAKNDKNRLVPMASSLVKRCREYTETVHKLSTGDAYYFQNRYGGPYDKSTIYCRFRRYLWRAGISHSGKGPRVHDLRHTQAVHCLKRWVLSGRELTNLLPYLAAYLGHTDFRGTQYYLRLTADLYPEIVKRFETVFGYLIPEKSNYNGKD